MTQRNDIDISRIPVERRRRSGASGDGGHHCVLRAAAPRRRCADRARRRGHWPDAGRDSQPPRANARRDRRRGCGGGVRRGGHVHAARIREPLARFRVACRASAPPSGSTSRNAEPLGTSGNLWEPLGTPGNPQEPLGSPVESACEDRTVPARTMDDASRDARPVRHRRERHPAALDRTTCWHFEPAAERARDARRAAGAAARLQRSARHRSAARACWRRPTRAATPITSSSRPARSKRTFCSSTCCSTPGDHVIAPYPAYQQLYSVPRAIGCDVSLWHVGPETGYRYDVDALERLITPRTKRHHRQHAAQSDGRDAAAGGRASACTRWRSRSARP